MTVGQEHKGTEGLNEAQIMPRIGSKKKEKVGLEGLSHLLLISTLL